ncbi:hypothetical protein C3K47_09820 [Solitalea longa]|uniref:Lipocalin-like domain-containing protein n=1 Tax=Solitalea longa TaxID=2079460 RepID=A0A2S5A2Y6_9SPHI|nr:hypothetical protein [Solitalea longa]POY36657.1 hypothetical protein C3K47_09820 [Solitalea longa]
MKWKLLFTLLTVFLLKGSANVFAQSDPKLAGKWQLLVKSDTEKDGPIVVSSKNQSYKTGEKSYEFTATSVIINESGKQAKTITASYGNGTITIDKDTYNYSFDGNKLLLSQSETKNKKGKSILETEEYLFQKLE